MNKTLILLALILTMGCIRSDSEYITPTGEKIPYIGTAKTTFYVNDITITLKEPMHSNFTKLPQCVLSPFAYPSNIQIQLTDFVYNIYTDIFCRGYIDVPSAFYYFDWNIYDEQIDLEIVESILLPHLNQINTDNEIWAVDPSQDITTSFYDELVFELYLVNQNEEKIRLMAKEINDLLIVGVIDQSLIDDIPNFYEWFYLSLDWQTIIFQ